MNVFHSSLLVISIAIVIYYILIFLSVNSDVIMTTSGPVKGKILDYEDFYYYAYQGIPYAEMPTGDLRFKPPVPKRPWTEVLNATEEGPVCPQKEIWYKWKEMSEDCLHLSIYAPVNRTGPLPVFVIIHGGVFMRSSGRITDLYGPQFFLKQGVVFVTVNYRLGPLGFLSLNIKDATGNAGIKDVILSLKWIKENIDRFGGDSNKITIGGNSSGAGVVHYLLLTKLTTGLFHRAILISGSILSYRFVSRYPRENALALAKELGLETDDLDVLLHKLKEIDSFDLINAHTEMTEYDDRNVLRPANMFIPGIEIESEHAVITKEPTEILKSGIPQNVPILVGFNSQEGLASFALLKFNKSLITCLNENFELCIPTDIEYPYGSEQSKALATSIAKFYFNGANITESNYRNYSDLVSDTQFVYATDTWIKLHKNREDGNALYYYLFDFDGGLNLVKLLFNIKSPGACHADDLGYLFVTQDTKERLKNIDTRTGRMLNTMTTLFSNFVKYGNPTPKNYGGDITWPEYGREHNYLYLNDRPAPATKFDDSLQKRLEFWNRVYENYKYYAANGGILEKKILP